MRAALLACLAVACAHTEPAPPPSKPELRDTTAAELKAAWPTHAPTVVHVWATWCDPCVEEFPGLVKAWRELSPRGVQFQFVSADFAAQKDAVVAFLAQQGFNHLSYRKAEEDQAFIDALDPRWTGTLPATMVFDWEGKPRFFHEGPISDATLVNEVTRVLCDPANPNPPRSACVLPLPSPPPGSFH